MAALNTIERYLFIKKSDYVQKGIFIKSILVYLCYNSLSV